MPLARQGFSGGTLSMNGIFKTAYLELVEG